MSRRTAYAVAALLVVMPLQAACSNGRGGPTSREAVASQSAVGAQSGASQSIFSGHTYPVPPDFVLKPAPANAAPSYTRDQVLQDAENSLHGVGTVESVDLGYVDAPQIPDAPGQATQLEWIVAITGVSATREVPPGSKCYAATPPSDCVTDPIPVTRFLFFNAMTGRMDMGENYSP
jgi:hypothetical protein